MASNGYGGQGGVGLKFFIVCTFRDLFQNNINNKIFKTNPTLPHNNYKPKYRIYHISVLLTILSTNFRSKIMQELPADQYSENFMQFQHRQKTGVCTKFYIYTLSVKTFQAVAIYINCEGCISTFAVPAMHDFLAVSNGLCKITVLGQQSCFIKAIERSLCSPTLSCE